MIFSPNEIIKKDENKWIFDLDRSAHSLTNSKNFPSDKRLTAMFKICSTTVVNLREKNYLGASLLTELTLSLHKQDWQVDAR